jgi:hypothetical protein
MTIANPVRSDGFELVALGASAPGSLNRPSGRTAGAPMQGAVELR